MKPGIFSYRRPHRLDEALEFLREPETKVLAGGQSLMPLLNMRLAQPQSLVDINHLPELKSLEVAGAEVRLGALVRHADIEESAPLARGFPLLPEIAAGIAYRAIRTRGTFCGSLAHADPAAEWPTVLLGLGGRVRVRSLRGEREIDAEDLFRSFFATSLEPDELIAEAVLPRHDDWHWGFSKFARKAGEFSLALALAGVQLGADGTIRAARVAVGGVNVRPIRLPALESSLRGARVSELPVDREIAALAPELDPSTDLHGSRDYKLALAATICGRALLRACA